ncbi:MAG: transglycosylase domain-containing protein [Clostridia bacterium]|nr:transglycosylase domain-containing protein [Clostridia bacterium]
MKFLRIFILSTLLFVFAAAIGAGAYYTSVTKDAKLCPEKLLLSDLTATVYGDSGKAVKSAGVLSKKNTVKAENLPNHTKRAFVDTEDKRFYSHGGFDFKRMVKAAARNLGSMSFKEGASTISQQLIKNTHLSQEKTIKRKLKEIKLTRQLESRYSKEEILEKYLNTIYFGHSCFGIGSASEYYFGKTPSELTVSESAILAGLVKSPNNYSPFKNPVQCEKRRNLVLSLMKAQGHIDKAEYALALGEPLPTAPSASLGGESYLRFVFDELETLAEKYSFTVGGRLQIYTYLDEKLQSALAQAAKDTPSDKTVTVLDAKTHGFKGCYSTIGNIARSPGSILKPLLVYAPAIELNQLSPATAILDEKTNFSGYTPENYGGGYSGYVSAREALAKSLNIPAVKVLNSVGIEKAKPYLEKLGLSLKKEDESLALALGGMKDGYSLKQLVSAYSAFSDGGKYENGAFIKEVVIDGRSVYKRKIRKTRVFSEETAYLTTDMLKTAAQTGTAKKLRTLPFPIAAKTGTAGTKEKNTDAYAVTVTTKDIVGVWLGNADHSAIPFTGGGEPCNIAYAVNEYLYNLYLLRNEKIQNFQKPNGVQAVNLDKIEYSDTHNIVLADENAPKQFVFSEVFKSSALPRGKSYKFSNPSISAPQISVWGRTVRIDFSNGAPDYYDYIIQRYDYATHSTVYQGKYQKIFSDEGVKENKNYIYTVIPVYNGVKGKAVVLPEICLKGSAKPPNEPPEITNKDWWEY